MANATLKTADSLPQEGFVRLAQVLRLIPVSKPAWYLGVKAGRYPQPIKLTARTAVYRVEDIRALIEGVGAGA